MREQLSTSRARHALAAVLLLLLASPVGAQETPVPSGPLTLDQVLTLAEQRSETVAIARAGVQRAEGDRTRARSGLFPQLSVTGSYDRAIATEFDNVFSNAGPTCDPFSLNPQAPLDARVAEIERAIDCGAIGGSLFGGGTTGGGTTGGTDDGTDDGTDNGSSTTLPFGRRNTWRLGLSFSQNLYSGGRIGAQLATAAAGREAAELGVTRTRAQLLYDVTQAYYDAALSDRLVAIAEATYMQAEATLTQTQAGFSAGTQPEFEVLRARVARDTQQPQIIRQRVNRDVALLRLKQLLDLPADYDLRLADSLGDVALPPPPVFAPKLASAEAALKAAGPAPVAAPQLPAGTTGPRTVVAEAATALRASEAALKLVKAQRMPSVTANSSYGRVGYPSGALPILNRLNWTVGASVQVPILTGGRQRGDEQVAAADLEEARVRLRQVEELAALDTRSAFAELIAAQAAWEASAGTVEQASRAYEIADVRYRAGVSTQLELSDSRLLLQQAETNRAQAARDLQVARARIALLPDLPISPGGAAPTAQPPQAPQRTPQAPATQQGGQLRNASAQQNSFQSGTR